MNNYGRIEQINIINDLIGKTFESVYVNHDNDEMYFIMESGRMYKFYHHQDCCEVVYIEDINGNLSDLENTPILLAEEFIHENVYAGFDSSTYTFYRFTTSKGYVDVRWCGESNGYYSESVDFMEV